MQQRTKVIAFHCSGASAAQWRPLTETMGRAFEVLAPEHIGCKSRGNWHGQAEFSLAHEAEPAIALIDEQAEPVHIVGHSYGGAVALHVAMQRPERVASLTLYEPSAFYLLQHLGKAGEAALAEISAIADSVRSFVSAGNCRAATETFVEYWNGAGSWNAMHPKLQNALISWTPKAPLDFHALFNAPVTLRALRKLSMPTLLMRGEHAPLSTRTISSALSDIILPSRLIEVAEAGHMGPITHAQAVATTIAEHIQTNHTAPAQSRRTPASWWRFARPQPQTWGLAT